MPLGDPQLEVLPLERGRRNGLEERLELRSGVLGIWRRTVGSEVAGDRSEGVRVRGDEMLGRRRRKGVVVASGFPWLERAPRTRPCSEVRERGGLEGPRRAAGTVEDTLCYASAANEVVAGECALVMLYAKLNDRLKMRYNDDASYGFSARPSFLRTWPRRESLGLTIHDGAEEFNKTRQCTMLKRAGGEWGGRRTRSDALSLDAFHDIVVFQ